MGSKPGRKMIGWKTDERMRFVKNLAGTLLLRRIPEKKHVRLWDLTWELLPQVSGGWFSPSRGGALTLKGIQTFVKEKYNKSVTENQLRGRADACVRTAREGGGPKYQEFDEEMNKFILNWLDEKGAHSSTSVSSGSDSSEPESKSASEESGSVEELLFKFLRSIDKRLLSIYNNTRGTYRLLKEEKSRH
jgi:hypothetical protein